MSQDNTRLDTTEIPDEKLEPPAFKDLNLELHLKHALSNIRYNLLTSLQEVKAISIVNISQLEQKLNKMDDRVYEINKSIQALTKAINKQFKLKEVKKKKTKK